MPQNAPLVQPSIDQEAVNNYMYNTNKLAAQLDGKNAPPTPPPAPTLPKPPISATSEEKIVSGTDNIRGDQSEVKYDGQGILNTLDSVQLLSDKTRQDSMTKLADLLEKSKVLTDQDLERIDSAGQAASNQYIAPIARARESARQGTAKSTVFGGERGGFMNTQVAGQAALTQTEGDTFVGKGGELNRIKGELEANIASLEAAQAQAVQTAREAARSAIMTGKRQDLSDAQALADMAIKAADAKEAAVSKRIEVLGQLDKMKQDQITFSQGQEDRSFKKLQDMAELGVDVPAELAKDIESKYGENFVEQFLSANFDAKQAKTEQDKINAFDKISQILARIPEGTEIKIGDATYTGYKEADPNTVTYKEDDGKNISYVTLDKTTGEILHTAVGGKSKPVKTGSGSGTANTSVVDESQMVNKATGEVLGFRQRLKDGTTRLVDPMGTPLTYSPDISKVQFVNIGTQKFNTEDDNSNPFATE